MLASKELRYVSGRDVSPGGKFAAYAFDADETKRGGQVMAMLPYLPALGIQGINPGMAMRMHREMGLDAMAFNAAGFGMDALQPSLTTASIATPIQFLQNWLPGFVGIITAARKADEILGMSTTGSWEDETIVQGTLEGSAQGALYGDATNIPLAGWNVTFDQRTIVRYEMGMRAGVLEEARSAKININSAAVKRNAASEYLEIFRNDVAFNGFNNGDNNTFGMLNDPGLIAAVPFPSDGVGSSPNWSAKSFALIQRDIRLMVSTLRTQSQDTIDPKSVKFTLVLPTDVVDYLTTTTDQGVSVQDWMDKAYPGIRVISCPQFELAISSENAAYLFAESVNDNVSTDDKRTWIQGVPAKFKMVGVSQQTKGYEEDYSNATAGVFLKRPYAVTRFYGC